MPCKDEPRCRVLRGGGGMAPEVKGGPGVERAPEMMGTRDEECIRYMSGTPL